MENFREFIPIFPEICGNLLPVKNFFHFVCFNYNRIKINNKHVFDKQFSEFLCFNFMHYVQKKIARLPRISANSNEKYRCHALDLITSEL